MAHLQTIGASYQIRAIAFTLGRVYGRSVFLSPVAVNHGPASVVCTQSPGNVNYDVGVRECTYFKALVISS